MEEPTLAEHQKAEPDRISKHNAKSAMEQHHNIYSSSMEGVKVQLQLLCSGKVYERRLAKPGQQDFSRNSKVHYLNRSPGKGPEQQARHW